ncbi:hypothetical protein A3J33_00700 [candidate division WWE3 bacterium RIFCSPLOWO2_02_FULL_53_10]|uniref:Uncharacterized protein n=1 Tax=candidate division WWE3 bacterium RIFCSPLOWO2_02_FULL_53_10 TaxID=1802629 RepID=A0A1F4WNE6_UNCKA|nr:MAG: hypothetical protein A3J33_00700 [candidate division WWE3 bacterium RIFCSPLOWO2_02_FULL_53_10]
MRQLAGPAVLFLASAYFVAVHVLGGTVYITLIALRGFWFALAVVFTAFGIWGSILYLVLLQLDAFDQVRGLISQLTGEKKPRFFARIQLKIFDLVAWIRRKGNGKEFARQLERKVEEAHAGREIISPGWIMIVFMVLSPLFAVPLIRLSFPRERWAAGLMWVWIGTLVEVVTWFLPLYGGASIVVRFLISLFGS